MLVSEGQVQQFTETKLDRSVCVALLYVVAFSCVDKYILSKQCIIDFVMYCVAVC